MINVTNLHYTYPGSTEETIRGIDFSVENGEIFGFLGPSGAGKSTTQKIIIGILKNYKGSVTINNLELKKQKSEFYENIGVAFEMPNLYGKFTAFENLEFFRQLYSGETEDSMKLLTMVGLETDAHTRVSDFSKGMKMRLNFIRALLNKPQLIFLDEPTSGLDPVNARLVKEIILQKRADGATVFLTTHNMHTADELCDRVAFIVDGKLALIDSPRELKVKNGERRVQVEFRNSGSLKKKDFSLDSIGSDNDFIELLKNENVETIHTLEASLEDIFIESTGRRLI